MPDYASLRHFGGGRRGLFILLRYVFIASASYLLLFQVPGRQPTPAVMLMIAAALASNVALSFLPARHVLSWYVAGPVLVADTLWVSWALHSTGAIGQEFFLLCSFVLLLTILGENVPILLLGSGLVCGASFAFESPAILWTPSHLLRLLFLYAGALFYGHVLGQLRRERVRADRGFARARELEAKVAERTEQLQRLYEQCLAASRLKSEFIASVSHELRTPLHIMMGYTEMLLDGDGGRTGTERDQIVVRIREASQGLLQLVDGLLDLRKLESGKMPLQIEPVRLAAFIGHFQRRERIAVPPSVALRWRSDPALPEIETDVAKLSVVLDNLVNNAIKFTRQGTITVSARDVPGERRVVFGVEDTGPGIPSEHLTAIFEPFHQVDGGAQRADGVGLGLAIARDYVSLLGGEISVSSKPGVGTSFEVTLPYWPGEPASVTRPAAERPREQRAA